MDKLNSNKKILAPQYLVISFQKILWHNFCNFSGRLVFSLPHTENTSIKMLPPAPFAWGGGAGSRQERAAQVQFPVT